LLLGKFSVTCKLLFAHFQ